MTRTPQEIIDSILATLEMAESAAIKKIATDSDYNLHIGRRQAFTEAIILIKTETKDMQ